MAGGCAGAGASADAGRCAGASADAGGCAGAAGSGGGGNGAGAGSVGAVPVNLALLAMAPSAAFIRSNTTVFTPLSILQQVSKVWGQGHF